MKTTPNKISREKIDLANKIIRIMEYSDSKFHTQKLMDFQLAQLMCTARYGKPIKYKLKT